MELEISRRIIKIISENTELDNVLQDLSASDDLTQLGIASITFIKIVVCIEEEFGIEFDDADLDYNQFVSLKHLCNYVENKIRESNDA